MARSNAISSFAGAVVVVADERGAVRPDPAAAGAARMAVDVALVARVVAAEGAGGRLAGPMAVDQEAAEAQEVVTVDQTSRLRRNGSGRAQQKWRLVQCQQEIVLARWDRDQ